MNIIIAGAGEVGNHLARLLSSGDHNITVIDNQARQLEHIGGVADIVTMEGDCTSFAVLKKAGVRRADLFVAVNPEESLNIISAMLAKQLGARKCVVRIDNSEYLEPGNKEAFIEIGIDYMFYPERIAAMEIVKLLGHTVTTEYVDFSNGRLSLVVFRLDWSSPLNNKTLLEATEDRADLQFRTVAISRDGETIIPRGDDKFMEGDMVYVITTREAVSRVVRYSGRDNVDIRKVMILGGSRIGTGVAAEMEKDVSVKLIEYSEDKAYKLSEELDSTLILNFDGRNIEALMEEGLSTTDAFVAVTGRSETNILAAMIAKRIGVKKVIAEVENINYINLAESIGIDTIINKKMITASAIFGFTMNTDVQAIKYLTGSQAEVLEFIARPNSLATKATVRELDFPNGAVIGGVVRGEKVFIATGDSQIDAYDRVVVFSLPEAISRVGKFFS